MLLDSKLAQRNGKLYVGEAAGFQDVWTGFGMRTGFRYYNETWYSRLLWPVAGRFLAP